MEDTSKSYRILSEYTKDYNYRDPFDGRPLSKKKRTDKMYNIVTNMNYGVEYTKEERILAAEMITLIMKE